MSLCRHASTKPFKAADTWKAEVFKEIGRSYSVKHSKTAVAALQECALDYSLWTYFNANFVKLLWIYKKDDGNLIMHY